MAPSRGDFTIQRDVCLSHRSRVVLVGVDCYKVGSPSFTHCLCISTTTLASAMHGNVTVSSPKSSVMFLDCQNCETKLTLFL